MKLFRIIGRSFSNALKSIIRNFSLSMASITSTIITLIIVAIGILLSYNLNSITKNIGEELTIVAFLKRDVLASDINNIKSEINKIDNVESLEHRSKEDIKSEISQENELFSKIIETWGSAENPLQDSLIIKVKEIKDIEETVTSIKNLNNIDIVKYGESMIHELIRIFDFIKNGTLILVLALILVTAFLINNTIKITIFSRKREIDIMRLVGTSNNVIKLPFLIEGLLIGFIGSIIPILITIFGYTFAYNNLNAAGLSNIMSIIKLSHPNEIVYITSLIILAVGCLVGMYGSVRAVRKYLTI